MQSFLAASGVSSVLLVDRSGQLITSVGGKMPSDVTAFASLTAADFSANDQLARLLGEKEFTSLFHQGERESMFMAAVAQRLILVALFDSSTTLGLVRLRSREQVAELTAICERMVADSEGAASDRPGLLAGAEDEIDQLFNN
jgi:predicted regulator of Ras-like GTPase activity (Roadblock/LC7/MglB family)